jgi:hypothetical protein
VCSVYVVSKKVCVQELHPSSTHGTYSETNVFVIEIVKNGDMQIVDAHFRHNLDSMSTSITTFAATLDLV